LQGRWFGESLEDLALTKGLGALEVRKMVHEDGSSTSTPYLRWDTDQGWRTSSNVEVTEQVAGEVSQHADGELDGNAVDDGS